MEGKICPVEEKPQPDKPTNALLESCSNATLCSPANGPDNLQGCHHKPTDGPQSRPGGSKLMPNECPPVQTQNVNYVEPTEKDREEQHWRFKGYPAFSTFVASSADAFVVRRFDHLQARILLMLQDEIAELEAELLEEDERLRNARTPKGYELLAGSSSLRKDRKYQAKRQSILHKLLGALQRYNTYLLSYSQLRERPKAPQRAVRNIQNWFDEFEGAIDDPEAHFINEERDLVAVVNRPKTPLVRILEKFGWIRRSPCFRIRKPRLHRYNHHHESENSIYYSSTAIDIFSTLIVLILGLAMLLCPAWWLAMAGTLVMRLTIISICVPLFMILLLLLAPLRPFETLAATAAYAAVLMVFMQLGAAGLWTTQDSSS